MQKKTHVILLALMISIFWTVSGQAADVAKIGIVDVPRILKDSEAGKTAHAQIKKEWERMEQDLKAQSEEIDKMRDRLEKEAMVMSRESRDEKEREFRIRINDAKALKKKYQGQLQEMEQGLLAKIQEDVMAVVEKVGKDQGYLLILNNVGVMYAPSAIDITDNIIKELDAKTASSAKQKP